MLEINVHVYARLINSILNQINLNTEMLSYKIMMLIDEVGGLTRAKLSV